MQSFAPSIGEKFAAVRFTTSHPNDFTPDIVEASSGSRRSATTYTCGAVGFDQSAACDAADLFARGVSGKDSRDARGKQADCHHYGHHRGLSGETESEFEENHQPAEEVKYTGLFAFSIPAAEYAVARDGRCDPEEEKGRRLAVVQEKKKASARFRRPGMRRWPGKRLSAGQRKSRREYQWSGTPHRR